MIKRRTVLTLLGWASGGAAVSPLWAQPLANLPRVAVVGDPSVDRLLLAGLVQQPVVATAELPGTTIQYWRSFFEELDRLGWAEGETVIIDRWSYGEIIADVEARARLMAAIRDSAPDLIVVDLDAGPQLAKVITTIPIVAYVSDPIEAGIATNIARPEGNVTGVASRPGGTAAFTARLIQLLTQIAPTVRRVASVYMGRHFAPGAPEIAINAEVVATLAAMGVEVITFASDPPSPATADIEAWQRQLVSEIVGSGCQGVLFGFWPELYFFNLNRLDFWPGLLLEAGLPSITNSLSFLRASPGALASYGLNTASLWPIMAQQVDRILRGAAIADVPFQATVDSVFRINLRTARALGLTISPQMLALATEVIE